MPLLKRKGFTLIEILIVIAIMGVLATLLMGSYVPTLKKGRDTRRKSDLNSISKALELYYNDNESYPLASANNKIAGCENGTTECEWGEIWETTGSNGVIYMPQIPKDPKGNSYFYDSDDGTYFQLYAKLENQDDPQINRDTSNPDDPKNQSYSGTDCGGVMCDYGVSSSNQTLIYDSHDLVNNTP